MSWVYPVKLPTRAYHRISLMINQHLFRPWLGAVRQQAITWTYVDQVLGRHMALLGGQEPISTYLKLESMFHTIYPRGMTWIDYCTDIYMPSRKRLTHWGLMWHACVGKLVHYWFKLWHLCPDGWADGRTRWNQYTPLQLLWSAGYNKAPQHWSFLRGIQRSAKSTNDCCIPLIKLSLCGKYFHVRALS